MKANKEKLMVAMARACMNAADIAKAAEMPRPTVNKALSGRNVQPATLGRIANALGVDVSEFVEFEQSTA